MVAEASQGRSLRLSGCDAGDRPGGCANYWAHGTRTAPRAATANRWKIRRAAGRLVDMFANTTTHQELSRLRQAELEAQARHADLIRRARAGQLQAELRQGRRYEQRARLATLMRGRPAPV